MIQVHPALAGSASIAAPLAGIGVAPMGETNS